MSSMPNIATHDPAASFAPRCRFCSAELRQTFVDLGMSPLCQTQIAPDKLNEMEPFFPLHVYVCSSCYLVQLEEFVKPEVIFGAEYPYYSSYSDSWVAHAKRYVDHVRDQFKIGSRSLVVEIASNDGYLLQHFVKAGVPCLGMEPTTGHSRSRSGARRTRHHAVLRCRNRAVRALVGEGHRRSDLG